MMVTAPLAPSGGTIELKRVLDQQTGLLNVTSNIWSDSLFTYFSVNSV